MKLESRNFSGKNFRPRPEALINEDLQMFAILTPWGRGPAPQKIFDFIVQNYESFCADEEKTNVYSRIESLSEEENVLRALMLSCGEWIFKEQNADKGHNFGCEIVCGNFKNGKLIFLQAGQPFVYLDRPDIPLQPLGHTLDFSGMFSKKARRLPPLPSALLGICPDSHFSIFSLPASAEDRLVFIGRDFAPAAFSAPVKGGRRDIDYFLSALTEENEESPFWIGILSL